MKRLSLLFCLITLLSYSCSTDQTLSESETVNSLQTSALSEIPSISPSLDLVNSIKLEIINSTVLKAEYDSLINIYGEFLWNKATYQPAEDGRSISCIPSEKDDQLTGMIVVFQHEGLMDFSFVDLASIMHVIQNDEIVDDVEFLATIFSLQNMLYYRYEYIHEDLNSYIKDYLEENQITLRNVEYAVEWVIVITDPEGNIKHFYTETRWHRRSCGGGLGGFTGPIFTNGNPTGDVGFIPTLDPKKWKIRTLVVDDEETDIEDIAECVDYAICNDLFNHINNLSGEYTVGTCSDKTATDLAIDIMTELCDNNIGDNNTISIEGSETIPNIICDIDKFDEMWEEAVAELEVDLDDYVSSHLADCPKVDCIYEKLRLLEGNQVCQIILNLEANDYSIHLGSEDIPPYTGTDVSPMAITELEFWDTKPVINLIFDNEKACESDNPLIVAEALLHEFLHAEFYVQLFTLGWNGTKEDFNEYWTQYLTNLAIADNISTHEAITKYYLLPIAEALWELNGKIGEPEDYYGYTLYGLYYEEEGTNIVNPFMTDYNITYEMAFEAFFTSENIVGGENMLLKFDCE